MHSVEDSPSILIIMFLCYLFIVKKRNKTVFSPEKCAHLYGVQL